MSPKNTLIDRLFATAVEHQQAGNLKDSEDLYKKILATNPNHCPSMSNLAFLAKKFRKYDLAIDLLQKLIKVNSKDAHAYNALGNIHRQLADNQRAIDCYQIATQIDPHYTTAYANLGVLHQQLGNCQKAAVFLQKAVQIAPDTASHHFNMGNVYYGLGKYQQAINCYQLAIEIDPRATQSHCNLAITFKKIKKHESAVDSLKRAIEIDSNLANAHYNLGNTYQELGKYQNAIECFQRALQINPNFAQAYTNFGALLKDLERYDEAIDCLQRALRITPRDADIYYNLGNIFAELLDYHKSNVFYQSATRFGSTKAINNYLMNLNYVERYSRQYVFDHHQTEAKKLLFKLPSEWTIDSDYRDYFPFTKVRIGYLSSDFREHSVAYFFESILEHHNRDQFEVFCFFNSEVEDEVTKRLRTLADHFMSIHQLSDTEAFLHIKSFNLHFLVELNGHTADNRLAILHSGIAYKVLSWIGYPNTTGLRSVDYKISDEYCDPVPSSDKFYTEELIRFDKFFMVYKPPQPLPAVTPSPYQENKFLTFGSFNNYKKINPSLIKIWASILAEFPSSTLRLKNNRKTNQLEQNRFLKYFEQTNIDAGRISFFDRMEDRSEHLDLYNSIDISLDTYPYSGTTTTFESLVMGVPVFTLAGQTHASRVTGSILNQLGLDQFIVTDPSNYARQLRKIVADKQTLARGYRQRLLESDLCGGSSFVKELEKKFRHILSQKPRV